MLQEKRAHGEVQQERDDHSNKQEVGPVSDVDGNQSMMNDNHWERNGVADTPETISLSIAIHDTCIVSVHSYKVARDSRGEWDKDPNSEIRNEVVKVEWSAMSIVLTQLETKCFFFSCILEADTLVVK